MSTLVDLWDLRTLNISLKGNTLFAKFNFVSTPRVFVLQCVWLPRLEIESVHKSLLGTSARKLELSAFRISSVMHDRKHCCLLPFEFLCLPVIITEDYFFGFFVHKTRETNKKNNFSPIRSYNVQMFGALFNLPRKWKWKEIPQVMEEW